MIKNIEDIKKEILDIISSTDDYQLQEALIFKFLYQIDSEKIYDEIMLYLRYQNFHDISYPSRVIPLIKSFRKNYYKPDEYSYVLENYQKIIEKIKILSKELNLTNSLEISLLFTHLLYNGYLSHNQKHIFKSKNLHRIPFMYPLDIFFGTGVCLNSSEMLTDILVSNNYHSATITNYFDNKDFYIEYRQEGITIDIYKESYFCKISQFIDRPNAIKYGNHACTLIFEGDKSYIFDPTNLTIYVITIDNRLAFNLNGNGRIYLKPYFSYTLCKNEINEETLEKLCFTKNSNFPYTQEDFISISKKVSQLVLNNPLLNSFYEDIKPHIDEIVLSFEKEDSKTKKRKLFG